MYISLLIFTQTHSFKCTKFMQMTAFCHDFISNLFLNLKIFAHDQHLAESFASYSDNQAPSDKSMKYRKSSNLLSVL